MKTISIIIATFNASKTLERCLKGIISQKNEFIELLVVDGLSSDSTLSIIKQYENSIDFWVSEKDNGIYDAWNKGIKNAQGRWIMFLGADDELMPSALQAYITFLKNIDCSNVDIVCARLNYVTIKGDHIRFVGEPWNWNKFLMSKMSFAHPGMLHSRNIFERYGLFDDTFKICGDAEFLLRTKGNINAAFFNQITVKMQQGGISYSSKAVKESFLIRKKNNSLPPIKNIFQFLYGLACLYKSLLFKNLSFITKSSKSILICSWISHFFKEGKFLVFCSAPAYTDNPWALYQYIAKNNLFPDHKIIWIVLHKHELNKAAIPEELKNDKNVAIYYKKNIISVFYYLRAKHVFFSHGLYSKILIHRPFTVINLWHGMPIKKIGLMDSKPFPYMGNTHVTIATSPFFQQIMSKSFGLSKTYIPIVGLPRNDLLFSTTDFFEKQHINLSLFKTIGLWLPTYRASKIGSHRIDGKYEHGSLAFMDSKQFVLLDKKLKEQKILLIIKLHPMDKLQDYAFPKYTNLLIVKQTEFKSQLSPLMGACDFLLTDYSSAFVDYLITNKPIGFTINDYEEYKNSRGFTIENLNTLLPGEIITCYEELCKFIEYIEKKRAHNSTLFNIHTDNHSCERLMSYLEKYH